MIALAHVGGFPLEEVIPSVAGGLVVARGWIIVQPATPKAALEMTATTTLRMKRTYEASAQRVFDAWTSEEVMRRWFHGHEWETPEAAVDLRVGGAVRVVMRDPDEEAEHGGGGHYTVIEPPIRLAFTWVWDHEQHETLIEIEFEESDGATTVHFTHEGLLDQEALRSHEQGWSNCFDNLRRALEAVPGRD